MFIIINCLKNHISDKSHLNAKNIINAPVKSLIHAYGKNNINDGCSRKSFSFTNYDGSKKLRMSVKPLTLKNKT